MKDQISVVTGANSGVGFETALMLAEEGGTVVLVCRDQEKGDDALRRIRTQVPNADLRLEIADLANMGEVRELGRKLSSEHPGLHLLVNNAGVYRAGLEKTVDGFERTLAVNHLSHFLLTHLVLPNLLAARGRVLNVSSEAHRRAGLDVESLEAAIRGETRYNGWVAYSDSKLANILFTKELARRYRQEELATCAFHPGVLSTRIWNKNLNPVSLLMVLFKPVMGKPAVGGEAALFLTQEPPEAIHGRYFNKKRERDPSRRADDSRLAEDLWEISLRLTGLAEDPPSRSG
ncbi:MAG: SDR family oxidoreductase [Gemmatimonadetes bacterium]|nr:SDR family oxidoreductase [Gemmatimonadota bacterium]NNM07111.1 SDR family oxidoreductase [Gemmatimonadota bacterium]